MKNWNVFMSSSSKNLSLIQLPHDSKCPSAMLSTPFYHAMSSSTATLSISPILSSHNHQHLPSPLHLPTTNALTRRSFLFLSSTSAATATTTPISQTPRPPPPDTSITDRVFMDFSICPTYLRSDRSISESDPSNCTESFLLGRLVLGLYGNLVPITVSNFKSMCTNTSSSFSYRGSLVHKIFPGQYFLAGRQSGRSDKGEVRPPEGLKRNVETVDPNAFVLKHSKAGVLSLCLSENDDEDDVKFDPNYRNVEFLITTGPGPCPQLDYKNIVFGTVIEGMDVVTAIAAIPTYKPAERIRQLNDLAGFFGDERAQNARATWNKPLKTLYISDCGELKVVKPSLSPPSLP